MRCPVCLDIDVVEHIRDGIEVDHCPRCQGIWLDRGELEKLLDLADARSPEPRITTPADRPQRMPEPLPHDRRDDDTDLRRGSRKRKRKGSFAEMLEDVFEVFD